MHQIPTMQSLLPGLQKAAVVTQRPWQVCSKTADDCELRQAPAGSRALPGPGRQLKLMAVSVAAAAAAAAAAPPDVMHPPSSAPWGWSYQSYVT